MGPKIIDLLLTEGGPEGDSAKETEKTQEIIHKDMPNDRSWIRSGKPLIWVQAIWRATSVENEMTTLAGHATYIRTPEFRSKNVKIACDSFIPHKRVNHV